MDHGIIYIGELTSQAFQYLKAVAKRACIMLPLFPAHVILKKCYFVLTYVPSVESCVYINKCYHILFVRQHVKTAILLNL